MEQNLVGAAIPAPASTVTPTPSPIPANSAVDRTRALYERPVVTVDDEATFREVKAAVEVHFSERGVEDFLKSLKRSGLRVRDFEQVLEAGKLGSSSAGQYGRLSPADQGQIRELYLASLELVALPLRDRFFKLYAYY